LYSGEQFDSKIGQQYLRQRYYDSATGRFNRLDPFFGNLSAPQTLHKYLYTHADPVNGIDPSGLFGMALGVGSFMPVAGAFTARAGYDRQVTATGIATTAALHTRIGIYSLTLMTSYFGFYAFTTSKVHPNDKTTAEYQDRMRYLSNMNRLVREISDAYMYEGGFNGVKAKVKSWDINVEGDFELKTSNSQAVFPSDDWSYIRGISEIASRFYHSLGDGQVYVQDYWTPVGTPTAISVPWYSGFSLSHEAFWKNDIYDTLGLYLHETAHCISPYFGHVQTGIRNVFPGDVGSTEARFDNIRFWFRNVKDNTGTSLDTIIQNKAKNDLF
jgi:RHS repeat-associated protein